MIHIYNIYNIYMYIYTTVIKCDITRVLNDFFNNIYIYNLV